MYMLGLDELDNKILEVIKDNARMSYSDIGKAVNLSRVAVKNRMDVMEQKGIIQGYQAVINTARIPEGVKFMIEIETYTESYHDVLDVLCSDKYIRQVYGMTGNCYIHCYGYAPNNETLNAHVRHLYRHNEGIRRMDWHMLMTTYKDLDGGVEYVRYKEHEHMEGE